MIKFFSYRFQVKTLEIYVIDEEKISSAFLKSLMNFFQFLTIFNFYGFQKNKVDIAISNGFEIFTGSFLKIFSLKCLLENFGENYHAIYFRALINSVMPIIFSIIFCLIFSLMKKKLKKMILITASSTLFLLQPTILESLFDILNCESIGGQYYIAKELLTFCYDSQYKKWVAFLVVPSFLIYAIIFPCYLFFLVSSNNKKIASLEEFNQKVGFLIQGYKKSAFYWELINFWKKITLICFGIFISNIYIKTIFSIFFLMILIIFHHKDQPFFEKRLNSFETIGNIALVMILLSFLMKQGEKSEFTNYFSTTICLCFELILFVCFTKFFLLLKIQNYIMKSKSFRSLKRFFWKLNKKDPFKIQDIKNQNNKRKIKAQNIKFNQIKSNMINFQSFLQTENTNDALKDLKEENIKLKQIIQNMKDEKKEMKFEIKKHQNMKNENETLFDANQQYFWPCFLKTWEKDFDDCILIFENKETENFFEILLHIFNKKDYMLNQIKININFLQKSIFY